MKTAKIIENLAREYPVEMACAWDNPGLQVGRTDVTVKKIMVALDATEEVITECVEWGAQLLVTHHPLLMSGVKKVTMDSIAGRRILTLAENKITHYAVHTNYDVLEMTDLAKQAMNLKNTQILEVTGVRSDGSVYGIGCFGDLSKRMKVQSFCEAVKKAFCLDGVRLFGDPQASVKKIALSPGSGKSMIESAVRAGADILVTGDIGHHEGIDAVDQGLLVIDAGHYGMEHLFINQMTAYLQKQFPDIKIKAAKQGQPFAFF